MTLLHRIFAVLLALSITAGIASAAEQNGILLRVTKKTVKRGTDTTTGATRNTQSLDLYVRNTSIRDFPEGEVKWTILVHRSTEGEWYKYTGTEILPPLRNAGKAEMMIGQAKSGRLRSDYTDYRDRVEYEVIINHGGKETIRTSSDAHFDELAAKAVSMDRKAAVAVAEAAGGGVSVVKKNDLILRLTKGSVTGDEAKTRTFDIEVTSTAIRDMPAGALVWTLLVNRGKNGGWVKYTGTKELPPLKPGDSAPVQISEPPNALGRPATSEDTGYLEYEFVVTHDGHERVRISSNAQFAATAAKAPTVDANGRLVAAPMVPAADGAAVAGKTMPPEPVDPLAPDQTPTERSKFDFFNLGKKGAKPAGE